MLLELSGAGILGFGRAPTAPRRTDVGPFSGRWECPAGSHTEPTGRSTAPQLDHPETVPCRLPAFRPAAEEKEREFLLTGMRDAQAKPEREGRAGGSAGWAVLFVIG
ncbi:hypothetical protein MHYP_G00260930 [Metynnis hypsauchen]